MRRRVLVFRALLTTIVGLLFVSALAAQEIENQVVTLDQMTKWAMQNHPIGRAAAAVELRGTAALLAARGQYDPQVQADYQRKEFLDKTYYDYGEAGLSWQSPFGLKFESGYQWVDGLYTNPERNIPDAGQFYLAVKLPVLRGLLTDKYRVGVQQAVVAADAQRAAAEVLRNEIRYDLGIRYLDWAYAQLKARIYQQTEELIAERLRQTRGLVEGGDKPAVDTLKAFVDLNRQRVETAQARIELQVAAQQLRAIYWPLPVNARAPAQPFGVEQLPVELLPRNPELATRVADLQAARLERRLKLEYLKPQLDLKYSLLGDGFDLTPEGKESTAVNPLTSAYKLGATFSYPLFARTARGNLELADIKLLEKEAKLESKRRELNAKVEAYREAIAAYQSQLPLALELVEGAQAILRAERELFALGESTQLTINLREQYAQKAALDYAKLQYKQAKAILSYRQAGGWW